MEKIKSIDYLFLGHGHMEREQNPSLSLSVKKRTFDSKLPLTMENLTSKILKKKINLDKAKIIPLNTPNNLGYIRHFPPATKEWSSSIYAHYNNNHIKSLPILDKNLVKLIKSYFNFYHLSENLKSGRRLIRFRRVSLIKIFVSKAELKHTNSKVIINIDLYNIQKRLLIEEMGIQIGLLMEKINIQKRQLMVEINKQKIKEKEEIYFQKKRLMWDIYNYYKNLWEFYVEKKFGFYLDKLEKQVIKIYKKKVEFNIVILKHMYLNSDILSQAISLKLRDRDNRVWKVLRSCLSMVQVPISNKYKEKSKANRGESLVDKIKKLDIYSLASFAKEAKGTAPCFGPSLNKAYFYSSFMKGARKSNDSLNQLLFGVFPIIPEGEFIYREEKDYQGWKFFAENFLKYKAIGGVRLEAKGRLTRRFTASRSVFNLKWKGGLKNTDSSYKGLSAVILRGHVKSNVQYTIIHSKNRIGSYGVKGWVSGK